MAKTDTVSSLGKKRKRESKKSDRVQTKTKTRRTSSSEEVEDPQTVILQLESQILESRRHYNNIATLIQSVRNHDTENDSAILAAVALCRVFSRLLSTGDMVKSKGMAESEVVIVQWLKERYREYTEALIEQFLKSGIAATQSAALTLLMRLLKQEAQTQKDYNWKHGSLSRLVETVLYLPGDDTIREEFVEKYFKPYDDIRFFTFQIIKSTFEIELPEHFETLVSTNALSILMTMENIPTSKDDLQNFYAVSPKQLGAGSQALSTYRESAQNAWLAALRSGMTKEQRKAILNVFPHRIAPLFRQPELLMDFLTDSYDVGGGTSLLALSGLYYLISEKNLDYPMFYQKLYSLLDENLLHSKYRSRFFRLLDTFMASTHLPAALVASFIKRFSRLALHSPPAGIVAVIPWIYNMFRRHPVCTFMIHREIRERELREEIEEEGMDDPFDMDEVDPMLSGAIESSLWEIETLQSHYHPNVATLAKIISEQFTKRSYNLEDFLDHSYNALIETELSRELKKEPVVEYEIPKRIYTSETSDFNPLGQLLLKTSNAA
ncbi:CBF-domain-containing protein [Aaosphaeria arxii CBS 175.79]|uniref:CBF-domain-containing protein n=1 Tax=Aaosphaeria arxii CBS 175.79 TaxID=1450172 RepID=A0A6A5XJ18_9PLEO|nr:CBF-domain-containing protein [Aaosphaeria arxii CBS 175.79]KAF2013265.1 CBF-domain-containing protein [Aaosphaeria arxii CBS 175.79]